jgi:hypothetical protein
MPEQRHFHRVKFDVKTEIELHGVIREISLVDISLKGALVSLPLDNTTEVGSPCRLIIHLNDPDAILSFNGKIVHSNDGLVGIKITLIDIGSMMHLRRLIALNSENSEQINSELHALLDIDGED